MPKIRNGRGTLTSSRKLSRKSLVVLLLVKKPQMVLFTTFVLRRRLVEGKARRARRTKRGSFPDTAFSICFTCSLISAERQRSARSGSSDHCTNVAPAAGHQRPHRKWKSFKTLQSKQTTEIKETHVAAMLRGHPWPGQVKGQAQLPSVPRVGVRRQVD